MFKNPRKVLAQGLVFLGVMVLGFSSYPGKGTGFSQVFSSEDDDNIVEWSEDHFNPLVYELESQVVNDVLPSQNHELGELDLAMGDEGQVFDAPGAYDLNEEPYEQPGPLQWKAGEAVIEPGLNPDLMDLQAQMMDEAADLSEPVTAVVQFQGEPNQEQIAELLAWGYEEYDYIPDNGFMIRLPLGKLDQLAEQPYVYGITTLRTEWKISPRLTALMAENPGDKYQVGVYALQALDLEADGPLTREGNAFSYRGTLTREQVEDLLQNQLVKWVEPYVPNQLSLATSVDVVSVDNVWAQGLDGSGYQVGIIDTGINNGHTHFSGVDFIMERDWVDGGDPIDCNGHGTHVAGTIAGTGTVNSQTFTGLASDATLIIERIFDCGGGWHGGGVADMFNEVADRGADVISNSWGHDSDEDYDGQAADTDTWVRDHENVSVVFAIGNFPSNCSDMHSPAIAKNVIAVGTTEDGTSNASNAAPPDWIHADDVDLVSTLNQCDLPEDNRTKPDINAPGEYITAPTLNNDYETWRGTSMSTPHVSGLLALYFDAANTTRRADLMKALLLNSAAGLGTKTGNGSAHQGFGRIQAMDFLYKLANETVDTYLTGEVGEPLFGHPEEQYFTVDVPSGAEFLVVTMTYLDRAGSTSSSTAMVNNLDLRIEPPSGTPTYVDPDRDVDTVEKMWFSDPASGTWTVKIRSESIPGATHNSQSYAVSARVVTEGPGLTNGYPSSVNAVQGTSFNINLTQTADDWFVYGAFMIAESNHADIDLASGSESGVVGGDLLGMYDESYSWSPSFVATNCGNFSNAIKLTMGATNFNDATYYVDVNVQCPCDKPGTPTLYTPASGSSTNDPTPFFDWSTASHATEYQIMVDNTPWDSPEINTTTSVSSYTSGIFLSDDWYNWAVRGHNTSGSCDVWGDWSTVWGFWVDTAAPLAPTLYSPANGSTTSDSTPYFDWSAPSGSVEYRIQIDNDANFSSPAINALVSSSNFTPGSSLSDNTYYWKVQGRDDAGNWSSWSSTWSVTIQTGIVGPLAYDSHVIDDDASGASVGDGDGIVDCGESIELNITLGNQGSSTATGVNATLSTSDSYVTNISDDYENFPDISGGGTAEDVYDYDFTVDGSTPDGHIIQFDLDINAALGGPWSDSFDVTVSCQNGLTPPADFDGDGDTDVSVYRPNNGRWYIMGQGNAPWGLTGDLPVPGDYDGDGAVDMAVFRPSNGKWYIIGESPQSWGFQDDVPLPCDYNGDGVDELAVYRPSNGRWYIMGQGNAPWGLSGDIPVPADYDGDGSCDIAIFRPSNGRWYIKDQGPQSWGQTGDIPIPGDYDGDGADELAVYRPDNGRWYIMGQGNFPWGRPGDIPVPGDYDGDGVFELAVLRPSNGKWYIKDMDSYAWYYAGDFPLPVRDTNGDGDVYD